jgi:hypothetical protein
MSIVVNRDLPNPIGVTKDCDISSSTSVESSSQEGSQQEEVQHSGDVVISSGCQQLEDTAGEPKLVKITVISLDGVVTKKYQPKSKLPSKQKKKNGKNLGNTAASMVASFSSQQLSKEKTFFTHLPSVPIEMEVLSTTDLNSIIQWPNPDDAKEKQNLSTVQITREFVHEKNTTTSTTSTDENASSSKERRFVPQTCSIDISISRQGKLIKLGQANLLISGEERGDSTINIPVVSSPYEKTSRARKSYVKKVKGNKKSATQFLRIKGDNLQFGLKSEAAIRVLVSVCGVDDMVNEERESTNEFDNKVHDESVTYADDDSVCVFDDDSIEQDDYVDYIKTANESNELRLLRQQLKNSEEMIQSLKVELDTSQVAAKEEIDRLCTELKHSTQNCETLLQELNQSKSESEMVPFLETRINEFLEELKRKDTEIECLRDEVKDIRKYYKNQVNTLLWDNQDPDNTKAANWKAAIGSAALKVTKHIRDREIGDMDEEKKNDDTLVTSAVEEPQNDDSLLRGFNDNTNESKNNKASNWRAALGSAAIKARKHIRELEFKDKDGVEEIAEAEKKSGDDDDIAAMEEQTDEKDGEEEQSDDTKTDDNDKSDSE